MMNRKTQWQMLAMATLVAGLGWIGTAQAELLVYEGFDYEAGANVVGQTGGDGWEDPWVLNAGTSSPTTDAASLESGLLQTAGGAASWTGSDRTRITRNTVDLSDYYDVGDTLYASFLASNTGSYEYKYFFGDVGGGDGIGWSTSHWSGSQWTAHTGAGGGLDADPNDEVETTPVSSSVDASDMNLFVMQFTVTAVASGEARTVDLNYWINPESLGGAAPAPDASFTGVSVNLDADETYFSEDPGAFLDEIRIGTTFADVTPIPEPATLALLSLGGLAMIRRRSTN
jgi:hypothetical protein